MGVAVLALGVLLGGCSGSSAGAPADPVASGSPLTVPLFSQPAVPGTDAAQAVTLAARDYYATVSAAANTGLVADLQAATLPSCACRSVATFISSVYARGERLQGFGYRVGEVGAPSVTGTRATVEVPYTLAAYARTDADGTVLQSFPEEPVATATLTLERVDGRWLVAEIEVGP